VYATLQILYKYRGHIPNLILPPYQFPVSTTHCCIGAVICIGYAASLESAEGDSDRATVAWGTGVDSCNCYCYYYYCYYCYYYYYYYYYS
jgi:hypothetical protein